MSQSKVVLITGSSSGIGRLAAHNLARKGHTVFASMRDIGGKNAEAARTMQAWAAAEDVALHVVELDVTSDTSVDKAVQPMFEPTLPDPQEPADVIAELIDMPAGTRPLRTVVGHVVGVEPTAINRETEQAVARSMQFMGTTDLLTLRKP